MAKSFQEVMDWLNNQDEEVIISKQEAIVMAERQEECRLMAQQYDNLRRAMSKIMAAVEEYKKGGR